MCRKELLKSIKYLLRFLPDKLYLQIYYFAQFHKFINFKNPKTYNEKLNWLKLNDRNPNYSKMVDKYEAKEYARKIIGNEYIIPTLGVWEKFDDIDFNSLPKQFVLKCTHDSEGLIIVKDKSKLNKNEAKKKIETAMKYNFFYIGREYPYKNVKPRIIAEEYVEDIKYGELRDYKFFCFDGNPKYMFIATDRAIGQTKFDYFDIDFNHLEIIQHYPNSSKKIEKPKNYNQMITLAKKLSHGIKHIRVDFYEVNGKLYFGELTFYHFSGLQPFNDKKWDTIFGNLINLETMKNDKSVKYFNK